MTIAIRVDVYICFLIKKHENISIVLRSNENGMKLLIGSLVFGRSKFENKSDTQNEFPFFFCVRNLIFIEIELKCV